MSTIQSFSHCHICGHTPIEWGGPRKDEARCGACGNELNKNATTVPVVLIPVTTDAVYRCGLLVIRRGKKGDPGYNKLAFPGGFQGLENWEDAAAREVEEGLGVRLVEPNKLKELKTVTVVNGGINLKFCLAPRIEAERLAELLADRQPNEEVSEWTIVWKPTELAFAAHTDMCQYFFAELSTGCVDTSDA